MGSHFESNAPPAPLLTGQFKHPVQHYMISPPVKASPRERGHHGWTLAWIVLLLRAGNAGSKCQRWWRPKGSMAPGRGYEAEYGKTTSGAAPRETGYAVLRSGRYLGE